MVEGLNVLQEKATPHSFRVGLQGAELIHWPQQEEESMVRISEAHHYLSFFGLQVFVEDSLQVRKLSLYGVLRWLHYPLSLPMYLLLFPNHAVMLSFRMLLRCSIKVLYNHWYQFKSDSWNAFIFQNE